MGNLDKAKVVYAPPEVYLPFGKPAILDCHFRANPPLKNLRWEKDGFLFDPYNVQVRIWREFSFVDCLNAFRCREFSTNEMAACTLVRSTNHTLEGILAHHTTLSAQKALRPWFRWLYNGRRFSRWNRNRFTYTSSATQSTCIVTLPIPTEPIML